jgi:small subunit ribosomal protein S7
MRRPIKKRSAILPDVRYKSERVEKFINNVMRSGKKNAARKVVYGSFDMLKDLAKVENPLEVFETALKNAAPTVEVRSRRVGGANYQVPHEVRAERRQALAMRWIISAARAKNGSAEKAFAEEIFAAYKNEGSAIKKKEDTHRMAEANRAFAHFAW